MYIQVYRHSHTDIHETFGGPQFTSERTAGRLEVPMLALKGLVRRRRSAVEGDESSKTGWGIEIFIGLQP